MLLLGLLVAPILGLLAGVSAYLGARAVFQGGAYVSNSPWESVGGLVCIAVTALVSVLVVRQYRTPPPWRTLLVVASLAAIPVLVFLYAWATLVLVRAMPALGIAVVVGALLVAADRASAALAARDR